MDSNGRYPRHQAPLPIPPARRRRGGPIERAVVRATNLALKGGELGELDRPLVALARSAAASVDLALERQDAYAVAAGGRQLAAYLDKLRLVDRGVTQADLDAAAAPPDVDHALVEFMATISTPDT